MDQYGDRKGDISIKAGINKNLFFGISRIRRSSEGIIPIDETTCCDSMKRTMLS